MPSLYNKGYSANVDSDGDPGPDFYANIKAHSLDLPSLGLNVED